jgi:uncharacterized cupredoxin-like copper-binding protein
MTNKSTSILAAALLVAVGTAWAHGDSPDMKPSAQPVAQADEEKSFGKPGDAKNATRTITLEMSDKMRFTPSDISVRQGETVKFVVKNSGQVLHEMVLGTMAELKEHHELMKRFPNMEHADPNQIHVATGKTGEMVWQFTQPGEFNFACLIPGHFEAGMVGTIKVTK